jgi:nucleoside-diphosphate-sugar epimerase
MPKAFVIGGRGQSGIAIGQRLVAGGWTVTATANGRQPDAGVAPGVTWARFDRSADDLAPLVEEGTDVVVDVISFKLDHARQLAGLGDRVGGAVVLSTLSVYSDAGGRSLDTAEDDATFPDWPVPVPESQPTLPPGDERYSEQKAAVEQFLRDEAPWPVAILRPGAIHGRYSRHLREWYFIKRALDGRRTAVLPYEGASAFQPTATVNLAELAALAAERGSGGTYNCGDLDPPSPAEISGIIDDLMGVRTERALVPGAITEENVGNHPWAVPRPVVSDMSAAQEELGYRQVASYAEAVTETVRWAVEAVEGRDWHEVFPRLAGYPGDLFDYAAEDAYLAARSPGGD